MIVARLIETFTKYRHRWFGWMAQRGWLAAIVSHILYFKLEANKYNK